MFRGEFSVHLRLKLVSLRMPPLTFSSDVVRKSALPPTTSLLPVVMITQTVTSSSVLLPCQLNSLRFVDRCSSASARAPAFPCLGSQLLCMLSCWIGYPRSSKTSFSNGQRSSSILRDPRIQNALMRLESNLFYHRPPAFYVDMDYTRVFRVRV
ncbi:hypothetical protein HYPSUDRAFT_673177 [Hypholoma sublateritium FD-334 SS-4]|uniref:Uncharacterized protein n=1 Tax=Hypholoma sublateritium (strain FD-334 SS-4) TaxID=945553 RepID=A0A0D2L591_HYPSF|nr:hypothetical protein HYPSUDRAFT_673177 [Hypholoma sublateritium FD-334 SS-4]